MARTRSTGRWVLVMDSHTVGPRRRYITLSEVAQLRRDGYFVVPLIVGEDPEYTINRYAGEVVKYRQYA